MTRFKQLIAILIDKLPEKERIILALFYDEGLLPGEIARIMDMGESEVTYLLAKAISDVFTCQNLTQPDDLELL